MSFSHLDLVNQIVSNELKIQILNELLHFVLPIRVVEIPTQPTNGFIHTAFNQIQYHCCIQHNCLLFCTNRIHNQNKCFLIMKHTKKIYEIHLGFENVIFRGTVIDGLLAHELTFEELPDNAHDDAQLSSIEEIHRNKSHYFELPEQWKTDFGSKSKK